MGKREYQPVLSMVQGEEKKVKRKKIIRLSSTIYHRAGYQLVKLLGFPESPRLFLKI